jgi:hypothetical protein
MAIQSYLDSCEVEIHLIVGVRHLPFGGGLMCETSTRKLRSRISGVIIPFLIIQSSTIEHIALQRIRPVSIAPG